MAPATKLPPHGTTIKTPGWLIQFSTYVSEKTGLRTDVVAAWVLAEGGPPTNPLNIGPGRNYGSLKGAADATIRVINQPNMAVIKNSAGKNAAAQIHAISASPWDKTHYGGDGRNLRGAYSRLTHQPGQVLPGFVDPDVAKGGPDYTPGAGPHLPNVGDVVGGAESWLAGAGTRALLYLTFTVLALAFVVGAFVGNPLSKGPYRPPNLQGDLPEGY